MAKSSGKGGGGKSHGKDVFVGPHKGDGKWQVKREGNERASVVKETQKAAIKIGREYARQEGSELVVQNRKGQIREKDSHGDESKKKDKD
jgi:hypothetical protein